MRVALEFWLVLTLIGIFLVSCGGPKAIPKFESPIFSLDNKDMVLRYRYDKFTLPISDPNARGAVCFLPSDFEDFLNVYLGACKEWDEEHELIFPRGLMELNGLKRSK